MKNKRFLVVMFVSFCLLSSFKIETTFSINLPTIGAIQKSIGNEEPRRYLDIVFDSVVVEKDVVFGKTTNFRGSEEELLLDIYQPAGDDVKNRPVIVWIHGGGFRYGNDKSQRYIVMMAERFAKRGYVCLSINYRLRKDPKADKEGTVKDALEDAQKGLDWLRANHEKLNVDLSRIIIGGGSAGGILASNLCYKEDVQSNGKEGIIGLVNLWGSPDQSYTFFEIDKHAPPTIIVHGTADELVSFENSKQLIEKLNHFNIKNELFAIEGAGHTPARHMNDFNLNISRFLFNLVEK